MDHDEVAADDPIVEARAEPDAGATAPVAAAAAAAAASAATEDLSTAVAVIAVHGVADQAAGATAQAVVDLLVAALPSGRYRATATEEVTMQVRPLLPAREGGGTHGDASDAVRPDATPSGRSRGVGKSLRQSFDSDFHRDEPHGGDRGIGLTRYLLRKNADNGARPEVYTTTRIVMARDDAGDAGAPTRVDVHELYWADLSRLSGATPRIVSEVFTMVFRLSKLGRETVEDMRRALRGSGAVSKTRAARWAFTSVLQRLLDWMIVNVLAMLFMQLAMLVVFLVALGTLRTQVTMRLDDAADLRWVHLGVAGAIVVGALLRLAYLTLPTPRRFGVQWLAAAVVVVAVPLLAWKMPASPPWMTACLLLGALTLANQKLLRIADDRFPFVHFAGTTLWVVCMAAMLWSAEVDVRANPAIDWNSQWIHAAMFVTEGLLFLVKGWWILAGVVLLAWLVAGFACARKAKDAARDNYPAAASIATGRLGVAISLSMFVAVTICTWTALDGVLSWSVHSTGYTPCLFGIDPNSPTLHVLPEVPANACPLLTADAAAKGGALAAHTHNIPAAEDVLADRRIKSSEAFSLLTTLLVFLLLYLAAMFVPSVLAELKLLIARGRDAHRREIDRRARDAAAAPRRRRSDDLVLRTRELGTWLTAGYRGFDVVLACFTVAGIVMCCLVAYTFVGAYAPWLPQPDDLHDRIARLSSTLLAPLILGAGSLGAALTLFGGMLSRTVPPLRAPLDVAMDVDNHFREFPRTNIPRARIFSRYAALLDHLRERGYGRVVIVSHSQGTVISTEFLRFLASRDGQAPEPGDTPTLDAAPLPPIDLLTVGCPLRQLYAARFPNLYAWVLARNGATFGPRAADIGVGRWINGFCSGDYVGRWLWSDAADDETALGHPMNAPLASKPFGRADIYADFHPSPPRDEARLVHAREVEVCLGLGAHTHYFESDQTLVAWLIDHLVRVHGVDAAQAQAATPVLEVSMHA